MKSKESQKPLSQRSDNSIRLELRNKRARLNEYSSKKKEYKERVIELEAEWLRRVNAYAAEVVTQETWDSGEWTDKAPKGVINDLSRK